LVHERLRELRSFLRLFQQGKVLNNPQAFGSGRRVPCLAFPHNNLGKVQLELRAPLLPPLARDLLMGGSNQITTWPGGQVARNRCFEVDARLHASILPAPTGRFNEATDYTSILAARHQWGVKRLRKQHGAGVQAEGIVGDNRTEAGFVGKSEAALYSHDPF
jgi:hypothetical protein